MCVCGGGGVVLGSIPKAKEVQEILLYYINNMYIGYWLLVAEFLSTV
jgi:hypothetical protein